ncbi:MAG: hypothetical protein ABIR56_18740 [Polaromonas sp.]
MSVACTLPLVPISSLDFSGFTELAFPENADIGYVLCFKRKGSSDCVPFYVGESARHVGRFGDYVAANFTAATDFKVGQAVKQLRAHGCEVLILYKTTNDRKAEEKFLIREYEKNGLQLLNRLSGYSYTTAKEPDEQRRVKEFTTQILFKENKT